MWKLLEITMIDREVAERVKSISLVCTHQLDRSVKEALQGAPEVHASMYRRLVGQVLGELFTEILMPIYTAYPDLEPEELKQARREPQPVVMPPEVGSKLLGVISSVMRELSALHRELELIPGKGAGNLDSALQEPLESLQGIQEFLRRVSPDSETIPPG